MNNTSWGDLNGLCAISRDLSPLPFNEAIKLSVSGSGSIKADTKHNDKTRSESELDIDSHKSLIQIIGCEEDDKSQVIYFWEKNRDNLNQYLLLNTTFDILNPIYPNSER